MCGSVCGSVLSVHCSVFCVIFDFFYFHLRLLSCRLMLFRSDRHSSKDWQHEAILGHQSVKLSAERSCLTSMHVLWYEESIIWRKQCQWGWIQCEVIDPTPKSVTYAFMNAFHKCHIHSANRICTSIWICGTQIPKMYDDGKVFVILSNRIHCGKCSINRNANQRQSTNSKNKTTSNINRANSLSLYLRRISTNNKQKWMDELANDSEYCYE